MSSTRFTFIPMTGDSGLTTAHVSAAGYNNTHGDYRATATLTAGSDSKEITLIQYGIPYASVSGGGLSAIVANTGGTIPIDVYAHYPFRFDGLPSWLTISDGMGNHYTGGQVIMASASTNGFTFTATPNTGTTERSGVIDFGFYRWGVYDALSGTSQISITQPAGSSEPYFIISPMALLLDYYSGATGSITVATNVNDWTATAITWESSQEVPSIWQLNKENRESWSDPIPTELEVVNMLHNNNGASIVGRIDIVCNTPPYSGSVSVSQAYEPIFSSYSTSIGHSGGTFHINLGTAYAWWFDGLPSWITITDTNDDIHYEQYNSPSNSTYGRSLVLRGHVSENETGNQRSATLRLGFRMWDNTTGSTYQQIIVTQSPAEDTIFVVPSPDSITFNSGATAGTMQVVVVSANTSWSASWASGTDNLFSLPYANTGSTGTTNLTIRYNGTTGQTASNAVLLFNNGPTVRIPVSKVGATTSYPVEFEAVSTSLAYTGGTVEFNVEVSGLTEYINTHSMPYTGSSAHVNLFFKPAPWAWDTYKSGSTFYIDGVETPVQEHKGQTLPCIYEGNNGVTCALMEGTYNIKFVIPSTISEEAMDNYSYTYGYITYDIIWDGGLHRAPGPNGSPEIYIFGDSD